MTKKDVKFNELITQQPSDEKNWITQMDKLLTDSGCKAAVDTKGNFTYTSKQSKKIVCRIAMGEAKCLVRPNTISASSSDEIKAMLPEDMLDVMRKSRGCGGCAKKNPNFVECNHGGPYQFSQDNENFESCRFVGFNFGIDTEANREMLKKWLECELAV